MRIGLLLACLFQAFLSHGQNVSIKNDVVYKDGEPYCRLVKSGGLTPRFSVGGLEGAELIVAQFSNEEKRYIVSFLGSGNVCYMQSTMGFGKVFAKKLVANNVIAGNGINPTGERLLIQQHSGGGATGTTAGSREDEEPSEGGDKYETVDRDRTKPLMVFGKKFSQDNVTVGSYTVRSSIMEGKSVTVFSISLASGQKIAEGYVEGIGGQSCRLVILKNNRVVNISLKMLDDAGQAKEIGEYLAGRYFL